MSKRTVTRDLEVIAEGDRGNVTIFSASAGVEQVPYSQFLVKFTLRSGPGIMNRTGLHWHETHIEYLRVSSGKAFVTVGGKTSVVDSSHGEICVPVGVVHEWGVAEGDDSAEDLIMWERTEAADGEKEIFFRNLISSFIDSPLGNPLSSSAAHRRLGVRDVLQVLTTSRALDNYPVVWNGWGRQYVTYLLLRVADTLGRVLFGLRPTYIEYTPACLWIEQKLKHQ